MNLSDESRVLLCCFLTIVKDTYGQMKPSNAVAEVEGEAIFNCSSPTVIPHWFMSKDGTNANLLTIALSCIVETSLQNHYKTEQIGGSTNCNLVVFDVTMEQAGAYWCTEISSSYALLTVIDKFPVTTYNDTGGVVVENENVILTCTSHHNGSVAPAPTLRPYFYWTNSAVQNVSSSYDSTTENTAVSQITVTAGRRNITGYTCHVYLKLNATTDPYYATNTPTVSNSVTNTPINVMYPPGNLAITDGHCANELEPKNLTCTADANPSAVYKWLNLANNITTSGSVLTITTDGEYECIATNCIRNQTHSNTTAANVTKCPTFPTTQAAATTSTIPSTTTSDSSAVVYVAVVISVYEIANLISMGFFLAYYNMKMDENTNENNSNIATSNKRALNNRFPWLEKMLPCMNPSYANTGQKCLGIFLFVLITIGCGVFIFPILILLVKKPWSQKDLHESQENSTLSLRLDDISGNVSGENRFRSPPSFLPPAPPSSHGGLVNRQASSTAGPPRPPPPPNKPTPSAVQHPLRLPPPLLRPPAMSEPINRDGAMEYAFLPFAMKPNLAPVQYLDEESHYTVLRRV